MSTMHYWNVHLLLAGKTNSFFSPCRVSLCMKSNILMIATDIWSIMTISQTGLPNWHRYRMVIEQTVIAISFIFLGSHYLDNITINRAKQKYKYTYHLSIPLKIYKEINLKSSLCSLCMTLWTYYVRLTSLQQRPLSQYTNYCYIIISIEAHVFACCPTKHCQ